MIFNLALSLEPLILQLQCHSFAQTADRQQIPHRVHTCILLTFFNDPSIARPSNFGRQLLLRCGFLSKCQRFSNCSSSQPSLFKVCTQINGMSDIKLNFIQAGPFERDSLSSNQNTFVASSYRISEAFFKIPYFREQFPRNLFFFEFILMYCDQRCGNYSREETTQGWKLFAEIRYLF